MKNYISRLLSVLAIAGFLILPAALFALTPYPDGDVIYPYNRNTNTSTAVNPQNYGQTHSYNVLLRGNGEAVAWATVSITNGDSTPISQLVFKTGNMSPRLFEVWQEMSGNNQYQYKKLNVQQSGKTATVTLSKLISQDQSPKTRPIFWLAMCFMCAEFTPLLGSECIGRDLPGLFS